MKPGTLFIVSTPIGNVDDIGRRAADVLARVPHVAAEDTRRSGQLLASLGIKASLTSYHDHNEREKTPRLLEWLRNGEDVALISDAGTPLVSDPGYRLVRAVREAGIPLVPVPGPSALLAALVVAGLPSDQFHFQGFLPAKGAARATALSELVRRPVTSVLYESPRRLTVLLDELNAQAPERELVLCRELTKTFETVLGGTVTQVREQVLADDNQQRGEMVLVLAGAPSSSVDERELRRLGKLLLSELPASRAARVLAGWSGRKRQELYQMLETLPSGE